MSQIVIQCPKCAWKPIKSSKWQCICGKEWNTFNTRGQCPDCKFVWKKTQCRSCLWWSRHSLWYVELDESVAEPKKNAFKSLITSFLQLFKRK
jgi:hypothetical protein